MERIIITFNQDGSFRGASITDFDGQPQPLDEAGLAAVVPSINTASLAAQAAAEADLKTEQAKVSALESYKVSMVSKVSSALASGKIETIQALAIDFLTPEQELKRAARLAEFEALKAELGL